MQGRAVTKGHSFASAGRSADSLSALSKLLTIIAFMVLRIARCLAGSSVPAIVGSYQFLDYYTVVGVLPEFSSEIGSLLDRCLLIRWNHVGVSKGRRCSRLDQTANPKISGHEEQLRPGRSHANSGVFVR